MISTDRPPCDWHDHHWPTTKWLTWSSPSLTKMTDWLNDAGTRCIPVYTDLTDYIWQHCEDRTYRYIYDLHAHS